MAKKADKSASETSSQKTRNSGRIAEVKEVLKKLEESKDFKTWHGANPKHYLASAFTVIEGKPVEWQICFYNKKSDRITAFVISEQGVSHSAESEVFKEPDKKLEKLEEEKIKAGINDVLKTTEKFQKETYPVEKPVKIIVVLHKDQELSNIIWNITYLTQTFKTLTVKVDAETGEIKEHTLNSLFSMVKDVK